MKPLNPTKKIYVYRNLRRNCLSLMQANAVIGHAEAVILTDVEFRVRESGRQRVLREQQKNVHAFTIGMLENQRDFLVQQWIINFTSSSARRVTYNPYKYPTFFDIITEEPIYSGARVLVTANNGIYVEED